MRAVIFLGLIFIGSQIGDGVESSQTVVKFFSWVFIIAAAMDVSDFLNSFKSKY